jgi:hypothetical protein
MADAHGSGPCVRKDVGVQVPPRPPSTNSVRADSRLQTTGLREQVQKSLSQTGSYGAPTDAKPGGTRCARQRLSTHHRTHVGRGLGERGGHRHGRCCRSRGDCGREPCFQAGPSPGRGHQPARRHEVLGALPGESPGPPACPDADRAHSVRRDQCAAPAAADHATRSTGCTAGDRVLRLLNVRGPGEDCAPR